MPDSVPIKAQLQEVRWTDDGQVEEVSESPAFPVQFNPETLKITYSNQRANGDQRGGGSTQFVGTGTTKLAVELVFDVTAQYTPAVEGAVPDDVRTMTAKVTHFMEPVPQGDQFAQRGLRFSWGGFSFEGVMDSMNETIEMFAADGRALRAAVTVEMTKQEIRAFVPPRASGGGGPGTQPTRPLADGQSLQGAAGQQGRPDDWRALADQLGVENPRFPGVGVRVPEIRFGRGR